MKIKIIFTLLLSIGIFLNSFSQKIYKTDYEYQADIKVYIVDYDYQADLCVHFVDYGYQADKDGLWFMTDYDYQADKKVFFVDYEYQAGWKNNAKQHLLK